MIAVQELDLSAQKQNIGPLDQTTERLRRVPLGTFVSITKPVLELRRVGHVYIRVEELTGLSVVPVGESQFGHNAADHI